MVTGPVVPSLEYQLAEKPWSSFQHLVSGMFEVRDSAPCSAHGIVLDDVEPELHVSRVFAVELDESVISGSGACYEALDGRHLAEVIPDTCNHDEVEKPVGILESVVPAQFVAV